MINQEQVNHIAKLARIKLTKQEVKKFQKELSAILDYIKTLNEVDVSRIEPTFHASEDFIDEKTLMRPDKSESQPEEVVDELIKSAPDKKARHIKVKAIFQ
jgi:aspartyl-tRNA(Asn)/glutamyl-tRNA(Gln) amidotransferase subunit C